MAELPHAREGAKKALDTGARALCGYWGIDGYTDEDLAAIYRLAL